MHFMLQEKPSQLKLITENLTKESIMTEKELIKEYVDDHYKHFDHYPIDVEVNGKLYDFKAYWEILDHD